MRADLITQIALQIWPRAAPRWILALVGSWCRSIPRPRQLETIMRNTKRETVSCDEKQSESALESDVGSYNAWEKSTCFDAKWHDTRCEAQVSGACGATFFTFLRVVLSSSRLFLGVVASPIALQSDQRILLAARTELLTASFPYPNISMLHFPCLLACL